MKRFKYLNYSYYNKMKCSICGAEACYMVAVDSRSTQNNVKIKKNNKIL